MARKEQVKFLGIKTTKRSKRVLIVVIILAAILLIDLFTPFGGRLRFASEWMRCGHRPYVQDGLPGGGVRFYTSAPELEVYRQRVDKYYCTPIEAERDGLSAYDDTWAFPHLKAAGEPHPYTKKPFLKDEP